MTTDQVPKTCCSTPVCKDWNCTLCEYGEDCEGDPQKIDYCPRPRECSSCGADCLQCYLWQKPVYFKEVFFKMTEAYKPDVVVSGKYNEGVEGSIQVECMSCGGKVLLSPSSQEIVDKYPDVPVYCIECFSKISGGS